MTTRKVFPAWAPNSIVDWHEDLINPSNPYFGVRTATHEKWQFKNWPNFLPKKDMADLAYRWASRDEMQIVWKKLKATLGKEFDDASYFICLSAISEIALYRSVKQLTRKQRENHFRSIATRAERLSQELDSTLEFRDSNVSEYLTDQAVGNFAHSILNVSFGEGIGRATAESRGTCDVPGTRMVIRYATPRISTLLNVLSERAMLESVRPPMTAHTAGLAAEINHLSRAMSRLFNQQLGRSWDATVSIFLQATYAMTISVDQVRKARKRDSEIAAVYTKKPDKKRE